MDREDEKPLNGHNCPVDRHSVTIARSRWNLLAKVLNKKSFDDVDQPILSAPIWPSSREMYGLFDWRLLENAESSFWRDDSKGHWLECTSSSHPSFSLTIRFLINPFSIDELTGFNNTGNVCVWPSEEVLAHYCLNNRHLFDEKSVLELGGGMTCLASLAVASSGARPAVVTCTDGNPSSVDNVRLIIQRNRLSSPVNAQVLDWRNESTFRHMESTWQVVLCSDCLFFDDGREALVDTMSRITTNDGLILIMAPRRGRTLDAFLELCQRRDIFDVYLQEEFDAHVTHSHHQKMELCPDYDADHNYPLLIQLKKREKTIE